MTKAVRDPVVFLSRLRAAGADLVRGALCAAALVALTTGWAGQPDPITSLESFDLYRTAPAERQFPVHLKVTVHYYDATWNVIWAGEQGRALFLNPDHAKLPFVSGDDVEISGFAHPGRFLIDWNTAKISVIGRSQVAPLEIGSRAQELDNAHLKFIEIDGYVDRAVDVGDGAHVRADVIVDARKSMMVWIHTPEPAARAALSGKTVRLRGILNVKREPGGSVSRREFWVAGMDDVRVVNAFDDDPRFAERPWSIEQATANPNVPVLITGTVQAVESERSITIRDGTGQVTLLCLQSTGLHRGDVVDALVWPVDLSDAESPRRCLVRRSPHPSAQQQNSDEWRFAEQVYADGAVTANHHRVRLKGSVTWSTQDAKFFFFEDATGGVKVLLPANGTIPVPHVDAPVVIVGQTDVVDHLPIVRAETVDLGTDALGLSPAPLLTVEQLLAGSRHARRARVRGFVEATTRADHYMALSIATADGDVRALVPLREAHSDVTGGVVEALGTCEIKVDADGRATEAVLWLWTDEDAKLIETPLPDPFQTERVGIRSLLQFHSNATGQRVRVSGAVLLSQPGRMLYLQDGDGKIAIETHNQHRFEPGERVEAVGYLGTQPDRPVLRAALCRTLGSRLELKPRPVSAREAALRATDSALVEIRGTVLGSIATANGAIVQLRSDGVTFDAVGESAHLARPIAKDADVTVTGVCEVQYDSHHQPRGFLVRLRSAADIRIERLPPWWTPQRLFVAGGGLLLVAVVAIGISLALARKNRLLAIASAELDRANKDLEQRVADRTRSLSEEVEHRRRSEENLDNQRRLLRTLVDGLPVALYIKARTGEFLLSNAAHVSALRATDEREVIGRTEREFFDADEADRVRADDEAVMQRQSVVLGRERRLPGEHAGGERWVMETKVPVENQAGVVTGLVAVTLDITARKQAEAEREQLQKQMLDLSRRAGMAEVASEFLHNVGNFLNTVNVAADLAAKRLRRSRLPTLSRLASLLASHAADLPTYFATDDKAKLIVPSLTQLGAALQQDETETTADLDRLIKGIEEIRAVLALQEKLTGVGDVVEVVRVRELIDEAVRYCRFTAPDAEAKVDIACDDGLKLSGVRHRLLNIAVALLQRAQADCRSLRLGGAIRISAAEHDGRVVLEVIDNGVGFEAGAEDALFAQNVRGSLHALANTIRAVGASISAVSSGPGQGAQFTVEFPVRSIV